MKQLVARAAKIAALERASERAAKSIIERAQLRRQLTAGLHENAEQRSVDIRGVAAAQGK